jgi:diguanylate cyclase
MSTHFQQVLDQSQRREQGVSDVEHRCHRYRQAFLLMLHEPFADLDSTLNRMLQVLATTLDVDRVSFWVFTDGREAIRCAYQYDRVTSAAGTPVLLSKRDYPNYFGAVEKQLVIAVDDAMQDRRTSELAETYLTPLGISSMLDVPVRAFGRYVGVLCHEHIGLPREWTAEEQHFASGVATQVALAHEREHAKRAQQVILQRSLHDEESQLPNCAHLDSKLRECLDRGEKSASLAITTVDQYSYVQGALGAQRMQELVLRFARQLTSVSPPGAFVARTAPNEFALLLTGVARESLPKVFGDWVAALKVPLSTAEQKFFLTLSTGYSHCEVSHVRTAEALRTEAQLAALEAKAQGGDRIRSFATDIRDRLLARARLEQDLRRGLEAKEFELYFQPIVNLNNQRCISVEALLRWNHPQRGLLSPGDFMSVAMESGVMLELGRRVIRHACEGVVQLRAQTGIRHLGLCINLSASEILLPGTSEVIEVELKRSGLPGAALVIEITESALMMDLDRAGEALEELRASGVRVSLDDFGTAYSSLSWLRQLPIDCVKIDRGFVAGIAHDRRDLAIIRSIVGLTRALEQTVVAEGIESTAQLELLQELGVEYGQGYFFAPPEPTARFATKWRVLDSIQNL